MELFDFEEIKNKVNRTKWYGTEAWYDILEAIGDCENKSRPHGEWINDSDNTIIAVKGMKMPKNCPTCPLSYWSNHHTFLGCNIGSHRYAMADKEYAESSTRPKWCPLVEVRGEEWKE